MMIASISGNLFDKNRTGVNGLIDLVEQRDALRVKLDDIAKNIKELDP